MREYQRLPDGTFSLVELVPARGHLAHPPGGHYVQAHFLGWARTLFDAWRWVEYGRLPKDRLRPVSIGA